MDAEAMIGIGVAVRAGACIAPGSGEGEGVGAAAEVLWAVGAAAATVDPGVVSAGGGGDVGAGDAVDGGPTAVVPASSGVGGASPLSSVLSGIARANGNSSSTVTLVKRGDPRVYPTNAATTTSGVPTAPTGILCRHTQ